MKGSVAVVGVLALWALGCGVAPPPRPAASVAPAAPAPPVARLLAPVPSTDDWQEFVRGEAACEPVARYLGEDVDPQNVHALGGFRFTVRDGVVHVAQDVFRSPVASGALLPDDSWLFLLDDGSLWRAPGPLGTPTYLGGNEPPHRFLAYASTSHQVGALAWTAAGTAYLSTGGWPPRVVEALPESAVVTIASLDADHLEGRLISGGVVMSADGGATFTHDPVPPPWREDELPPHQDAAPEIFVRALLRTHPAYADRLGIPLAAGGSVWSGREQSLFLARDGDLEEIAGALPSEDCELDAYRGGVAAMCDGVWITRDGRTFEQVADHAPYARVEADTIFWVGSCDGGPGRCVLAHDGSQVSVTMSSGQIVNARMVLVEAEDGSGRELRRIAADGTPGELVRRVDGARVVTTPDDSVVVLSEGAIWSPEHGRHPLPDFTRVAVLDARRLVALDAPHARLRASEDGGAHWVDVVTDLDEWPSLSPASLSSTSLSCTDERCYLEGALVWSVDLAPGSHRRDLEVVMHPGHESLSPAPLRAPRVSEGAIASAYALRCRLEPARAPRPRRRLRSSERAGLRWWVDNRARRGGEPLPPRYHIADVAFTGDAAVATLVDHRVVLARPGRPLETLDGPGWYLDAVSTPEGGGLVLTALEQARWYELGPDGSVQQHGELHRNRFHAGSFGFVGSEDDDWRLVVPTIREGEGIALERGSTNMPAPIETLRADTPRCRGEPAARSMRLLTTFVPIGEETSLRGVLILDVGPDGERCVRAFENRDARRADADVTEWSDGGRLEVDALGQLTGRVRIGGAWHQVTCD